jgi:hypothetical protein
VRWLLRLLVVVAAVYAAAALVPGVTVAGEPIDYLVIALIVAVVSIVTWVGEAVLGVRRS